MRIPHGLRAALAGQGTPAPSTDANFENTVLLLHGDGTNGAQNNTFTDGSTNNFTITRNGNTTQGTFSPYGDNWSNYFDGTGDYFSVADNAALDLGTGDFTIEGWVYIADGIADNAGIVSKRNANTFSTGDYRISYRTGTSKISFADDTINERSTPVVQKNTWTHFAIVRASGTLSAYANGVRGDTAADSVNLTNGETQTIGVNATLYFTGYMSNIRILKGTAVYSGATYTIPTTPLTAITNTSLLTCQSNRFRDASTNNFTITRNGDVSVQRFSPFSPAAAYSSSTIGGSGYFDGTGDYLSVASNTAFAFGTGSLTVEAFINTTTKVDYQSIIGSYDSGGWFLQTTSTGVVLAGLTGSVFITGTINVCDGAWHHIAMVRSGSTLTLYIDGVADGTLSSTTDVASTTEVRIGGLSASFPRPFTGYISSSRVVKGTAVYTAAFTPPTSPLTAITNTSLLLNFTNGGIIDNTMMNDLETVGNAQISTSVKKYGTGSLAFDGTGDWLLTPNNTQLDFGSGNFTVEYWINFNSVSGIIGVFGKRISEANYAPILMYLQSSALQLLMSTSGSSWNVSLSTSTLSTGTWYHIAVCRSGTTVYLFLNGTSVGSTGTASGALITNTAPLIVGADSTSPSGASPLNGYIDDLRITKGVARYTANFTPPTAALPDL